MNAADITHSAVEAVERVGRAAQVGPEAEARREARKRAQEVLHADVPDEWKGRAHLGVSSTGTTTQVFSGADCGCSKPADFSGVVGPLIIEGTSPSSPYATLLPERQTMNTIGKNPAADAAAQLAARVGRSRATFAAKKTAPVVLFDQNGVILGLALDPSKITQPDKQNLAAFDSQGQLLGMIAAKDITAVAAGEPVGRSSRGVAEPIPQQIQPSPQMAALKRAGFR